MAVLWKENFREHGSWALATATDILRDGVLLTRMCILSHFRWNISKSFTVVSKKKREDQETISTK